MGRASLVILILGLVSTSLFSQTINPTHVYWLDEEKIFDYDPGTHKYDEDFLKTPYGSSGLAIANHPNRTKELTFYTTVQGMLYYLDGKKWINTNHYVNTVNIAGGGDYLYIL